MAKIFLSHSSQNNREALAMKVWLESQGWKDEVFLDFDPETGIKLGQRWKEALTEAHAQSEALLFLISPEWISSPECLAEYRAAEYAEKRRPIFFAQIAPFDGFDKTGEWQGARLFGEGPTTEISLGPKEPPVHFLADGLARIRLGLLDASISGILPETFTWPPIEDKKRDPYRGLEPLDVIDAGVYFGRDGEILQGLAELEKLRLAGDTPLFVILGASGTGKSSFLRAGLIPRLKRDDRHFYPLTVVRPESSPIFGDRGLARSIHYANNALGLRPKNFGDIKIELSKGAQRLEQMLSSIQATARKKLVDLPPDAPSPTLILPVDQAEELFIKDNEKEAAQFLNLIGGVLHAGLPPGENKSKGSALSLIVAFTIRSDRYAPLQAAKELSGLKAVLFDSLKPMPQAQFKEIIVRPAERATRGGRRLEVKPDLVQKLLEDYKDGADTLPLLSLTLSRLYREFSEDGDLRLDEYEKMGGIKEVIKSEIDSILDTTPDRQQALEALHDAFIPSLVTIDTDTRQPVRKVADLAGFLPHSCGLIQALIDKRLLLVDNRDGRDVVEIAHESLLRLWKTLADWLETEKEDLRTFQTLEREALAWKENKGDAWLFKGERLTNAEALFTKPRYKKYFEEVSDFLIASRTAERLQQEKEERQRQAEIIAAQEKEKAAREREEAAKALAAEQTRATERLLRRKRQLQAAIGVVLVALISTIYAFINAEEQRNKAEIAQMQANGLRLAAESQAMANGVRAGGNERAILQLLAAWRLVPYGEIEIESGLLTMLISKRDIKKIIPADAPVTTVAFSPDGSRIISGSSDSTLRLWDAKTGQPIGEPLHGHEDAVLSVAFSPGGSRIVSGSDDSTLRLWNAKTGKPIGEPFRGHEGSVGSVDFSPDGRCIVSGSVDETLRLWDANTGKPIGEPLRGHEDEVSSVAFSPDGSRIISGSGDYTLRIWDAKTGQSIGKPLQGNVDGVSLASMDDNLSLRRVGPISKVAFSPDGSRIVSASSDTTLQLWDAKTGRRIGGSLRGHDGAVSSAAFSPDGSRIVSGSWDKTLRLWDAKTGKPIDESLRRHKGEVSSVAFSPDGTSIVSGSWDKTLRLWDVETPQFIAKSLSDDWPVPSLAISPDGSRIVSNNLQLWDVTTAQPIGKRLRGRTGTIWNQAFSPDGNRIVTASNDPFPDTIPDASNDHTLQLWDAKTGEPIGEPLRGHKDTLYSVAFSPDGSHLVSGSWDKTLRLWDAKTGEPIGEPLRGHKNVVTIVVFSPDGSRIASGSSDSTIRLWDAKTGEPIGEPLHGHESAISSVAFSSDGSRIVSGSTDTTVRLWDARTGMLIGKPMRGHEDEVSSVAFSPDGTHIVSGSADKTLRLWDTKTCQPIGEALRGHKGTVYTIAFNRGGRHIVSYGADSALLLWPAPKIWPEKLCNKLIRNMSREEWRKWVSPDIPYVKQCQDLPIPPDESQPSSAG